MTRLLFAIAAVCAVSASAFAAESIDNAEWGFRVIFPTDVTQKVVQAGGRPIYVASSADGKFGLSVSRYDAPPPDPAATLAFMTKPDSSETVVSSKALTVPGAIGREVVLLKTRSAFSMDSGYEVRRVYVRGAMVYRVDADYPEGGSDAVARAFVESFSLR